MINICYICNDIGRRPSAFNMNRTGTLTPQGVYTVSLLKDDNNYAECFSWIRYSIERLNAWQWVGVSLAIISLFLLARSGKREGIDFKHNKWIFFLVLAAMMGTCSGLLDKYLMASPENGGVGLDRMMAQSWYNIYQCIMMGVVLLVYIFNQRKKAERTVHFSWKWSILLISIFLSMADFAYFYALSLPGAMISIVSMVRRGSVLVSFLCGALLFREKNLKAKAIDLCFVLLGMIFLWIGSR